MEGKKEHRQELPAARFGAGMVVFKQCGRLFFGKMLAVKKDNDFVQTNPDFWETNLSVESGIIYRSSVSISPLHPVSRWIGSR